jgi:nicotinamidase/pyrazinamidase
MLMNSEEKLRPETTLFYDVDTQRDFMLPGGALYVSGSETILPALKRMTELARRRKIRRICSMDRHFPHDRELTRNGGAWPDHCMDGTAGQRKVDQTTVSDPHPLPAHEIGGEELETALRHRGELIIEKQDVDVIAGNANARAVLSRLARDYDHIVIYGVYTDVCVDHAVNALLEAGKIPYVIIDAIHEIDPGNAAAARARWSRRGVRTISQRELADLLDH